MEALLTTTEVAKLLRVSRQRVVCWCNSKALKGIDIGDGERANWRVTQSEVERFMREGKRRPKLQLKNSRQSKSVPDYFAEAPS